MKTKTIAGLIAVASSLATLTGAQANIGQSLQEVFECAEMTLDAETKPTVLTILHYSSGQSSTGPTMDSKVIYENGNSVKVGTGIRYKTHDHIGKGYNYHYQLNVVPSYLFDVTLEVAENFGRAGPYTTYMATVVLGVGSVRLVCEPQLAKTELAPVIIDIPNHR